jgi:hypothetical protein
MTMHLQKEPPLLTTAVQGAWTDCQIVVLVLSCESFWNSSCANFVKSKSVLDDSMTRTVTDA